MNAKTTGTGRGKAFTLVEIIVGLIIASVVLIAGVGITLSSVKSGKRQEMIREAVSTVQRFQETIQREVSAAGGMPRLYNKSGDHYSRMRYRVPIVTLGIVHGTVNSGTTPAVIEVYVPKSAYEQSLYRPRDGDFIRFASPPVTTDDEDGEPVPGAAARVQALPNDVVPFVDSNGITTEMQRVTVTLGASLGVLSNTTDPLLDGTSVIIERECGFETLTQPGSSRFTLVWTGPTGEQKVLSENLSERHIFGYDPVDAVNAEGAKAIGWRFPYAPRDGDANLASLLKGRDSYYLQSINSGAVRPRSFDGDPLGQSEGQQAPLPPSTTAPTTSSTTTIPTISSTSSTTTSSTTSTTSSTTTTSIIHVDPPQSTSTTTTSAPSSTSTSTTSSKGSTTSTTIKTSTTSSKASSTSSTTKTSTTSTTTKGTSSTTSSKATTSTTSSKATSSTTSSKATSSTTSKATSSSSTSKSTTSTTSKATTSTTSKATTSTTSVPSTITSSTTSKTTSTIASTTSSTTKTTTTSTKATSTSSTSKTTTTSTTTKATSSIATTATTSSTSKATTSTTTSASTSSITTTTTSTKASTTSSSTSTSTTSTTTSIPIDF